MKFTPAERRAWTRFASGGRVSLRRDLEWSEQVEVIDRFRAAHPEFADVLIHPANGGSRRNAYEGWRLKRAGVTAGVSDLFLAVPVAPHHGLWIELKASGIGKPRLSPAQAMWLTRMAELGYCARLCIGADAAIRTLDDYLAGSLH